VQLREIGQVSGGSNINGICKRHASVDLCIFGFSYITLSITPFMEPLFLKYSEVLALVSRSHMWLHQACILLVLALCTADISVIACRKFEIPRDT
jgi:hypothetical protein